MKRWSIALLLLVFACQPVSDNPNDNLDYRHGTDGLVLNFEGMSKKIYSGSELGLVIEVRNKGAYDIQRGYARVFLSGYDPTAIQFGNDVFDVQETTGKNPYVPEGGYSVIEISENGAASVPFGDSYEPTLMATSCYKYQTLATPGVCVVSSPSAIIRDDVCTPGTITMSSQGAPVAVTKVEEEVGEQTLNFIITVENKGDGKVVDLASLGDKCPFNLKYTDLNLVNFNVEVRGQSPAECTPVDNKVRLVDGKGVFYCKVNTQLETSYTTPLIITLDYGYSSSITKRIEIVNPPGTADTGDDDSDAPFDPDDADDDSDDSSSDTGGTSTTSSCTVYISADGRNHVCRPAGKPDHIIFTEPGQHTFTVTASGAESCWITGGSKGDCPQTVTLNQPSSVSVAAYDADGKRCASEVCNIQYDVLP